MCSVGRQFTVGYDLVRSQITVGCQKEKMYLTKILSRKALRDHSVDRWCVECSILGMTPEICKRSSICVPFKLVYIYLLTVYPIQAFNSDNIAAHTLEPSCLKILDITTCSDLGSVWNEIRGWSEEYTAKFKYCSYFVLIRLLIMKSASLDN